MSHWRRLIVRFVTCLASASLCGFTIADEAEVIELVVTPAPEPTPALKYRFTLRYDELSSGNAATLYYRAVLAFNNGPQNRDIINSSFSDNGTKPAPLEVRRAVDRFDSVWQELKIAASRETSDWDLPTREAKSVFYLILPEMQGMRSLARYLVRKAQIEADDRDYDQAVETIRACYALSLHVGQADFLISGLVGLAVAQLATDEVVQLATKEGSPNLYWALATLPRPMFDYRRMARAEECFARAVLPSARELPAVGRRSAEWWEEQLRRVYDPSSGLFPELEGKKGREQLEQFPIASVQYTAAKEYLKKHGYDADDVESISVSEAIVRHLVLSTDIASDELFKWQFVPYEDTLDRNTDSVRGDSKHTNILVSKLLPELSTIRQRAIRCDRRIAQLQCVEALRMYAAKHEGKLPPTVDQITSVPWPRDPITHDRFRYRLEGDVAVIEAAHGTDSDVVYRVRIKS